jgi:tRNA A37 N6-isopentenylltransferase MiaA
MDFIPRNMQKLLAARESIFKTPMASKLPLARVKIRTRRFAQRQRTWFRRDGHCEWIEPPPGETAAETTARLDKCLK